MESFHKYLVIFFRYQTNANQMIYSLKIMIITQIQKITSHKSLDRSFFMAWRWEYKTSFVLLSQNEFYDHEKCLKIYCVITTQRKKTQYKKFCCLSSSAIDYGTQVTHLLFFDRKIGDFKIAGLVCLQKKVCLLSPTMYFW